MEKNSTNPFLAYSNIDFSKFDPGSFLKNASMPGLDVQQLLETQRKNIEALAQANAQGVEGVQAIAKRQADILAQTMSEMQKAVAELGGGGGPRELAARQADLMKLGFERAIANMREVAEIAMKSNNAAADTINQRVSASLDEIKKLNR